MSWNRWLPAALAAMTLAAGCAGGSQSMSPPVAQSDGVPASATHRFSVTTAPTDSIKKFDAAVGTSSTPTWQFIEPLDISDAGVLSVANQATTCSPIDPIFGVWYLSLQNFTTPLSNVFFPSCTIASPAPGWGLFAKRPQSIAPVQGNLYIVELSVGLFSIDLTPITSADGSTGSYWYFTPLQSSLTFKKDTIYAFFIASYNGTGTPSPVGISL